MDSPIKSTYGVETSYDVKDPLMNGLSNGRPFDSLKAAHPLEQSLSKHFAKQNEISVNMLTKIQGIHAPLRLEMEKRAVRNVGHLPCLYRHNAMMDALTGRDIDLDFEDFLDFPRDSEKMVLPHVVIEKDLGL